jgi:hypothetical protein
MQPQKSTVFLHTLSEWIRKEEEIEEWRDGEKESRCILCVMLSQNLTDLNFTYEMKEI